jgi:BirA family transcriptional regulator, biotin operon repressor / biotin---[acetyl-CoA-carboxylase] ligase
MTSPAASPTAASATTASAGFAIAASATTASAATASGEAALPWREVEVFDRLGSTNDEVRARPLPWRVVVAERQDAGRGRMGRRWTTTPGASLAVSVLVPPVPDVAWVPFAAGLAVHSAIADVCPVVTSLKWPNDVLVPGDGDRKLAGILCEQLPGGVVVGVGVNIGQDRDEVPVPTATSLRLAGAGDVGREALLEAYLTHLAGWHATLSGPDGSAALRSAYLEACSTLGRDVVVDRVGRPRLRVRAIDVDPSGRLVGRDDHGRRVVVSAGDVVHARGAGSRRDGIVSRAGTERG